MQTLPTAVVAPSGCSRGYPYTPDTMSDQLQQPLLSAQQRGTICSPAMVTYANANPSTPCQVSARRGLQNCADVRLAGRNIEGGDAPRSISTRISARDRHQGDVIDGGTTFVRILLHGEHVPGE